MKRERAERETENRDKESREREREKRERDPLPLREREGEREREREHFLFESIHPFSDHSQITLYIKQSETSPTPIRTPYQMIKMMSFKWTENSATNYINAVESPEIQSGLHSFQTQIYPKNQFGINQEVQDLNNILYKTAQKSNLTTVKPKKKRLETDKWFDLDCKALRKNLRNLSNQKHRQPDNPRWGDVENSFPRIIQPNRNSKF